MELEHHRSEKDGVRLHVVEAGSGAPVVLLHGFPDYWRSWRHQLAALAAAGLRVLAPDLRGYAASDKPEGMAAYAIENIAGDVAALIHSRAGGRAALVGHDWGGVVAWHLAARSPELVSRLAILNAPHPDVFVRELRRGRQAARSLYAAFFAIPALPELALRAFDLALLARGWRAAGFTPEEVEEYRAVFRTPGALTPPLNWYRAAARSALRRARERLPRVAAPTLVIHGMRDAALDPRLLDGLERRAPDLRIERFADAGHWVHVQRPQEVNALLVDFLAGGS